MVKRVGRLSLVTTRILLLRPSTAALAPLHEPLDRAIDRFPTGLKGLCRFSPAQPPRPTGEKAPHGQSHRPLAVAPRNVFDHHAVFGALDPPWCITEPSRYAPERHKQPTLLRQTVIAWCGFLAHRAASANAAMRRDGDLDLRPTARAVAQAHVLINKPHKGLHSIQYGLNLKLNS